MSEKLNHRKNTRQVHTGAVVNTMKSKIDPTKAAAAVGLAAGGVIVERGVDNGEKVDSVIGESYKTARDQQHELPDLQVIQEQKGQQISEERDQYLLEMSAASNSKVLGLFGRPRSFSEPANKKKTLKEQARLEKKNSSNVLKTTDKQFNWQKITSAR